MTPVKPPLPLAFLLLLSSLLLFAPNATAAPLVDEAPMREFMTKYLVPRPTQDALIARVQRGELPDSELGTATPVRIVRIPEKGFEVTKSVFADGSISVTRTELPLEREAKNSGVVPMAGVSGCRIAYVGTGHQRYSSCKADGQSLTLHISFIFSYDVYDDSTGVARSWYLDDATGLGSFSPEGFTQPGGRSHLRYGGWQDVGGLFHTYRYLQVDLSGHRATATMR